MNLFETIKSAVTMRQAAEFCGMVIERNDTCHCPFHSDHTPSMKLYPDHYYCFSCHEHGDAINLTAKVCNLSPKDAATQLAEAYHVDISNCISKKRKTYNPFSPYKPDIDALSKRLALIQSDAILRERDVWIKHAAEVLTQYRLLINEWMDQYAPKEEDEDWHPLFVEACAQYELVEYLFSLIDDPLQHDFVYNEYLKEVNHISDRITQYRAAEAVRRNNGADACSHPSNVGKDR